MARSNSANGKRHGQYSRDDDDRDDPHCRWGADHSHDHDGWPPRHSTPVRQGDDRYEYEIDLDKRCDGIDFELDMERHGKWLDVEIELGSLDIDLKFDARKLEPDTSPIVSLLGGEGTAVGDETLVDADIFSRLIDFGSVTIAFGTAEFSSVAVAGEGLAFAAATTFADVSGADFVFVFNDTTTRSPDCNGYAMETATTRFIAIDFEEFDFKEGQVTFNSYDTLAFLDGCRQCRGDNTPNIDGNVSVLDVDAQALGENTLVDVLSSILTIDGQLSSVSAVTVSAVG